MEDSLLNQTALMNLENRISTTDRNTVIAYATLLYIFAMPIVVLANYSKTIKGLFELAASVSGKFIFSAQSYIYPSPFQIIIYICYCYFFLLKNRHFLRSLHI